MSSQGKSQYSTACAGGCGFFGNPAMQNYCSICFKRFVPNAEILLNQNKQNIKEIQPIIETTNNNNNNNNNNNDNANNNNNENIDNNSDNNSNNNSSIENIKNEDNINNNDSPQEKKRKKVRCQKCNKKLALAQQFGCKCGNMFCSMHRFADCHDCTFDYQKIQQEKLESLNPVVAPFKVQQI